MNTTMQMWREAVLPSHTLKYRADIDGLRAVAVLSVTAFHIDLFGLYGGFVGVDIFFVISGYLISSMIFSEIDAGRFSIVTFYERRIRRIFPALFAMLLALTVAAIIYIFPVDLVDYSKSLLAAVGSVSNFYFWNHSGYFDSPTTKPLLHTWSLAVEEQFYIFFPVFLLTVRRFFPHRLKISVIALFTLSLATSAVLVYTNPNAAFYMPYTRAWELLMGTLISLGVFPRLGSAFQRNAATLVGLGMILYSVFFYSSSTPFPGLTALLPCLGSALIIGAGAHGSSLVGRVLSLRPVVFVGLISYSVYLWHWPVIVLHKMGVLLGMGTSLPTRLSSQISPHRYDHCVELLLSLVLGALSWRFIERPFRRGGLSLKGPRLFATTGAAIAGIAVFCIVSIISGGFRGRFSPEAEQIASYFSNNKAPKNPTRRGVCFLTPEYHWSNFDTGQCLHQVAGKSNYLLVGDSHSAALWPGLSESMHNANILQASVSACRPTVHAVGISTCSRVMEYIFRDYLPQHPVQKLLLQGRWETKDIAEIGSTIGWAKQHHIPVVLIGPVPEYDAPLPRLLGYSIAWHEPGFVTQHRTADSGLLDSRLDDLAGNVWHVPYISLYQTICNKDSCTEYADAAHKVPLMADGDHLSEAGAVLVARRLIDQGELQ